MDIVKIQTLIAQGRVITDITDINPNETFIQVGVYQPDNRKIGSANNSYPPFVIPLSELGGSGGGVWGTITGLLSNQLDLQAALDAKENSLGFIPYNSTNPAGYISGINGSDVTTALGYTPYNATNPAGYIDATALTPYQLALGFTPEDVANKSTDVNLSANSDTLYPSQKAVKTYIDSSVTGVLDDRGNWDASTNLFPTTGGSGPGGSILKGDLWFVSVPGTLGGTPVVIGDNFRALVDNPTLSTDWNILNSGLGYIAENVINKSSSYTVSSTTTYANTKALVDGLATKTNYSIIVMSAASFGPGDNTTYYFSRTTPSTSPLFQPFLMPYAGTIVGAQIIVTGSGAGVPLTALSTLNIYSKTLNIVKAVLSTSLVFNVLPARSFTYNVTGLNVPYSAGEDIQMQLITPTWSTNPSGVGIQVSLYVKM